MKKTVYISEFTQEQFFTKKEYDEHIKSYKAQEKLQAEREENIKTSLNIRLFIDDIYSFPDKIFQSIKGLCPETNLLKIHFSELRFSNVSNSHSSPIGFEQNFMRKPDKPLTYPGWYGTVTFVFSNSKCIGRDWLDRFDGLNTGSGCGGGSRFMEYNNVYVLSYELRLYIYDFPLIHEQYKRYLELKELHEKNSRDIDILSENTLKLSEEYQRVLKDIGKINLKINKLQKLLSKQVDKKYNIAENVRKESEDKCRFIHSDEFNELRNKLKI